MSTNKITEGNYDLLMYGERFIYPSVYILLHPSLLSPFHLFSIHICILLFPFILYLCCRWSALSWAATRGHGHVVRLLLENSADPTRMNTHGQRPADIALAAGFPQVRTVPATTCLLSLYSSFPFFYLFWWEHKSKTRKLVIYVTYHHCELIYCNWIKTGKVAMGWFSCQKTKIKMEDKVKDH